MAAPGRVDAVEGDVRLEPPVGGGVGGDRLPREAGGVERLREVEDRVARGADGAEDAVVDGRGSDRGGFRERDRARVERAGERGRGAVERVADVESVEAGRERHGERPFDERPGRGREEDVVREGQDLRVPGLRPGPGLREDAAVVVGFGDAGGDAGEREIRRREYVCGFYGKLCGPGSDAPFVFAWPQPRLWPTSCVIVSPFATARIEQALTALKYETGVRLCRP